MIGIVLVSHSRALGQALADLVQQVSTQPLQLAVAGGAGDDHQEFGTDAIDILEAIQSVYSPDGVLILMDLGSAILSAEMALELLPPEMQKDILFCPAPLIEGAIAAGVQAGLGADLQVACQEAQQALLPKREQLGYEVEMQAPAVEILDAGTTQEITLVLHNRYGLHARPAARFVQTAAQFDAQIQVHNLTTGKGPVSAKSLNALATLGAVIDHEIRISAAGAQATEALQALKELVDDNFGEKEVEPAAVTAPVPAAETRPVTEAEEPGVIAAIPIAEGIALGPLYRYQQPPPPIPTYRAQDPQSEWTQLEAAIEQVRGNIQQNRRQIAASLGEDQAAIFDAHLLILEDPDLLDATRQTIFDQEQNAPQAWQAQFNQVADQYRALQDEYLQQRAADVVDVGNQVLYALAGDSGEGRIEFPHPVILLAEELTPTQTAQLDLERVNGVITLVGGPTSHTAILSRSLGIPAISGAPPSMLRLPNQTPIALDGSSGALWVDPETEVRQSLMERRERWLASREQLLQSSHQPAVTLDGHPVEVVANAGNLQDAQAAIQNGAEGIGLLRTEFLFLTRKEPPDETEQYQALSQIAGVMGERPVIVRTLDVGGDKPLPYIDLPEEANPFLGVRAIRLSRKRPDLFQAQLRAILRAGAQTGSLRIMFPMVADIAEVQYARQALEQVHQSLLSEGEPHQWPIETGIMVEVPSAALLAPLLAPHVDFFSIGTNDLTQYTLAAERGNPELAAYADGLHPAVLRLIQQVVASAHQEGRWVGVCGELAGDPVAAPVLIGLGVDELSMNAASIPRIKAIIRALDHSKAQEMARQALECLETSSVRRQAAQFLEGLKVG